MLSTFILEKFCSFKNKEENSTSFPKGCGERERQSLQRNKNPTALDFYESDARQQWSNLLRYLDFCGKCFNLDLILYIVHIYIYMCAVLFLKMSIWCNNQYTINIYNLHNCFTLLVSAIQHSESAVCSHISPPSSASLSPPIPDICVYNLPKRRLPPLFPPSPSTISFAVCVCF